jgi:hypothetical protein
MVTRQERIDAFVMRVYRRLTDRSKSFAKITLARMSFRSCADGVMAYGEA